MKTSLRIGQLLKPTAANLAVVTIEDDALPNRPRHHALLVDASGSMYGSLGQVRKDAIAFVERLNGQDRVSVIVFSGHGRSRVIVIPTVCNPAGKQSAIAAIQRIELMDTTVFSEPLAKAVEAVKMLAGIDAVHAVTLFTDGCAVPTEWNVPTEHQKVLVIARTLESLDVLVNIVGYGVYYDAAFMQQVMDAAGNNGIYRHASEVGNIGEIFDDIREVMAASAPKRLRLTFTPDKGTVRRIFRTAPEVSSFTSGHIEVGSMFEGRAVFFLELSGPAKNITVSGTVNGKKVSEKLAGTALAEDDASDYLRLSAAAEFMAGNHQQAAELLRMSGDTALANRAGNAWTDRERREIGDRLRRVYRNRQFIGAGLKDTGPNNNVLNVRVK